MLHLAKRQAVAGVHVQQDTFFLCLPPHVIHCWRIVPISAGRFRFTLPSQQPAGCGLKTIHIQPWQIFVPHYEMSFGGEHGLPRPFTVRTKIVSISKLAKGIVALVFGSERVTNQNAAAIVCRPMVTGPDPIIEHQSLPASLVVKRNARVLIISIEI